MPRTAAPPAGAAAPHADQASCMAGPAHGVDVAPPAATATAAVAAVPLAAAGPATTAGPSTSAAPLSDATPVKAPSLAPATSPVAGAAPVDTAVEPAAAAASSSAALAIPSVILRQAVQTNLGFEGRLLQMIEEMIHFWFLPRAACGLLTYLCSVCVQPP